jgi:hypothetical protein
MELTCEASQAKDNSKRDKPQDSGQVTLKSVAFPDIRHIYGMGRAQCVPKTPARSNYTILVQSLGASARFRFSYFCGNPLL